MRLLVFSAETPRSSLCRSRGRQGRNPSRPPTSSPPSPPPSSPPPARAGGQSPAGLGGGGAISPPRVVGLPRADPIGPGRVVVRDGAAALWRRLAAVLGVSWWCGGLHGGGGARCVRGIQAAREVGFLPLVAVGCPWSGPARPDSGLLRRGAGGDGGVGAQAAWWLACSWRRRLPVWDLAQTGGARAGCDLGGAPQPLQGGSGLPLGVLAWMWAATSWWWLMAVVWVVSRRRPDISAIGPSGSGLFWPLIPLLGVRMLPSSKGWPSPSCGPSFVSRPVLRD